MTNPLKPTESKRTVCLETVTPHYDIERSKLEGKREAYKRRNEEYIKSMYGDPIEKEEVRRNQRIALQQQVLEQQQMQKKQLADKYRESEFAIQYDKACLTQDREDRSNRKNYLKKFRDENKRLMEERAKALKTERHRQDQLEQALLKENPINWSKTLH